MHIAVLVGANVLDERRVALTRHGVQFVAERVEAQIELGERLDFANVWRNVHQIIVRQLKALQTRQIAELVGQLGETVVGRDKRHQLRTAANFHGQLAQFVVAHVQLFQRRQQADLWRQLGLTRVFGVCM